MEGASSTTEQEPIPVASQGQKKALFPSRGSSDRDLTKSVPLLVSRERPMGQKTRRGVYMCVLHPSTLQGSQIQTHQQLCPQVLRKRLCGVVVTSSDCSIQLPGSEYCLYYNFIYIVLPSWVPLTKTLNFSVPQFPPHIKLS